MKQSEITFISALSSCLPLFLPMKQLYTKINNLKVIQISWDLKEQHTTPIQTISMCTEDFYTCWLNPVEMGSLYKTTCVTWWHIIMEFHMERVCHHEGKGWIIIHEVTRLRPAPVDVISLYTFPKTGSKFNLKIRREANELSSSCEMDKNHASSFRVYYSKKVRSVTFNTYSNPTVSIKLFVTQTYC